MPTFEITSPDGGVFEITAPEGASEQDILSYAQSQFAQPYQPQFSGPESALAGGAQGYSMGLGDEVLGGLQAAGAYGIGKGMERLGMNNPVKGRSLADLYRSTRDRIRNENRAAQEQNPGSYATGEIGGAIATPANKILPGAGQKQTVANMAKGGATFAGINAFGHSEAENPLDIAKDVLTQAATGGVLTPAIGKAMQGGGQLLASGVKKMFGVNPQAVTEAAQAGVNLPVSAVSERPTTKLIDRFLTKFPGSIGVMKEATDRTLSQIDDEVNRLGGSRAVTQQEAGAKIQEGAERYVNKFQNVAGKLYDRFDKQVGPTTAVPLTNLRQALAKESAPFANHPELRFLMPQTTQSLEAALAKGQDVPYGLVKKLRTSIGDKLSKSYLLADEQQGALKSLYGALTEDMKATATVQGPAALKAFERANSFYKKGAEQIEGALQKVTANKYPEQVYTAALSGTKQGGSKIQGIMKALNSDEQEVLRGTVIKRMGLATPGQQNATGDAFSVNTYLTNWNSISPEAKNAIFGNGEYRKSVDRLANVVSRLKEVDRYSNVSNTAPYATMGQLLLSAIGGGIVSGPGTSAAILSAVPGGNVSARVMTSPKFVNWLADNAAKPATPQALAKALERLPRVAASEPEIQDELKALILSFSPESTTNQGE